MMEERTNYITHCFSSASTGWKMFYPTRIVVSVLIDANCFFSVDSTMIALNMNHLDIVSL